MCAGTNCKDNDYCESGLCVNGICALSKTNINTCTIDVEAACGKCDKVECDDDQDIQCQNGSCNDRTDAANNTAYCYDSKFWLTILISVIVGVFLLVVTVVTLVECRRRKQRREQAAENEETYENQTIKFVDTNKAK